MNLERITTVLPVDDLPAAVNTLRGLLGVDPSFVDADRWAQFDCGAQRIALAGKDKRAAIPSLMIKVKDVSEARRLAIANGMPTGAVERGLHEMHCTIEGPGGWPITFYSPLAGAD